MTAFRYRLTVDRSALTVEEYRLQARRAVPKMVWAFLDHGAEDLVTLTANRAAFGRYRLKTKVLTGKEARDLAVSVAGVRLSLPVLFAPTGLAGLVHWTGEMGAAQAAEQAGTRAILSTGSSYSFEEVAESTQQDHFFQLYPWADLNAGRHDLTLSLMDRAKRAGYKAMFITVDVPVRGNRHFEVRHGMGRPPTLTPAKIIDGMRRPRWTAGFLRYRRISGRNLVESVGARAAMSSLDKQFSMMRPDLNWDDFAWMRENWDGPLFIKGVLDADDAEHAVNLGADGVVVSNHGGRQLDEAVATLDALPAIAARVGGRAQILLDGGIRRGTDVIKALCLGATAVCVGRPYLYGLGAGGPAGAREIAEILRREMSRAMTLMGVESIAELDRSWLLAADKPVE